MPTGQKYLVHDLKTLDRGATVVVHLSGSAANVRLMDSLNYQAYKSGRSHRYAGGLVKKSPHRIFVPRSGHWYLTVDMAGLRGTARARVAVDPPPFSSVDDTAETLSERQDKVPAKSDTTVDETWDVFICHAGEDKREVAVPLYKALLVRDVKGSLQRR